MKITLRVLVLFALVAGSMALAADFLIALLGIGEPLRGLLTALLTAILTAGSGSLLLRWCFLPLHRLAGDTEQVDSDDPLLQALAERLQNARREVQDLLKRVSSISSDLSLTSSQIFSSMEQAERSIDQQRAETEQVATAMNEMTATVEEVARNTAEASDAAGAALDASNEGLSIARTARSDIEVLVENVDNASRVISRLEEESGNIGVVLDVIKGIAEQTNLLALNAAIEAARAGEQGRGFAVVADEVRTLASRTQESTREIEEMISRLQEGVRDSVAVMEVAVEKGQGGSEQVGRTLAALDTILTAVNTMSEMNAHIASATEEQSQVANEINRNIVNINQQGVTTAEDAATARQACEQLAGFSTRLQELTSGFGSLDLSAARAAHLNWKTRLRSFLDGKESLTMDEAVSHRHCKFGKWYYSEGLVQYGHLPALQAVEQPHEELHELVRTIIEYKERGDLQQAEDAYQRLARISETIVKLLNETEQQAAGKV